MTVSRVSLATIVLVAFGGGADAAGIVCHEGFQVVNGQELSTPYCNDNYVAQVARSYGYRASNEAVRNNPSFKNEICRKIGSDIRIKEYCDVDHGTDYGR